MDGNSTHYTVLARRFRPQTFDAVVGQQHVAQALRNAIRTDRVAHAYLFTGARGVGKTSSARIFAKALNCPNVVDGVPCNECDVCQSIATGNDVDVSEIDGASNRGIDDIRSLRANVNVKSMRTKFKVYIIDEVHMLTKEAFNALLKTLEEPPPNVKFVFCTTEPNKVPDTILSRCQRFDFASIDTTNISQRLTEIAQAEGRAVEPKAIELVARRATGSMRDSQSLFDQLLAFGGETITADDVHRLLGTASDDRLLEIGDALVGRQSDQVLALLDRSLSEGVQLGELFDQIVAWCRDVMVTAAGAQDVSLSAVGPDARSRIAGQAEQWGLRTALAGMQILSQAKTQMMRTTSGRPLAELALVRLSVLEDLTEVSGLVESLRSGAAGNAPQPSRAPSPPQKKTPDRAEPTPPPQPSEPEITLERIPLESGSEGRFLSQLKSAIEDATADHLGRLNRLAISGPNRVELVFPASYDFGRSYCQQPNVLERLTRVASTIAGQPVSVAVSVDEATPEETREREPEPIDRPRPDEAVGDEFAERTRSIFEATIVRVEETTPPAPADSEEE